MGNTNLSAGRLGEPKRPPVRERVLDIEILLVVENCDRPACVLGRTSANITPLGRDGDSGEIDLLRHVVICDVMMRMKLKLERQRNGSVGGGVRIVFGWIFGAVVEFGGKRNHELSQDATREFGDRKG